MIHLTIRVMDQSIAYGAGPGNAPSLPYQEEYGHYPPG